jgi:hypothetical protein
MGWSFGSQFRSCVGTGTLSRCRRCRIFLEIKLLEKKLKKKKSHHRNCDKVTMSYYPKCIKVPLMGGKEGGVYKSKLHLNSMSLSAQVPVVTDGGDVPMG